MKYFPTIMCAVGLLCGVQSVSAGDASSRSLYDYHATLVDQDGKTVGLDVYRDHPVVIAMFYSSCQYSCPLLLNALAHLETRLDATHRQSLRILLVSFDPDHDTPAVLHTIAMERHLDLTHWKLLHADANTVSDIAALLGVTYRAIPGGGFNHTAMLTLLDEQGVVLHAEEDVNNAADHMVGALQNRKVQP